MDWLKKLLGLADDASDDVVRAALNALLGLSSAIAALLGVDAKAALAMNAEALKSAFDKKFGADVAVALCTEAGVQAGSPADAIVAAIRAKGVDLSKYVTMAAHSAVTDQLKVLNQANTTSMIDDALRTGKLVPAEKDWAVALAAQNPKALQDYLGVTPVKVPDGEVKRPTADGKEPSEANNFGLTESELAMCSTTGRTAKEFFDSKVEIAARPA